jgi:flagellar P-ring protein FlgI
MNTNKQYALGKVVLLLALLGWTVLPAARIKDVAKLQGVSDIQLVGYGLVVGLAGTGDSKRTEFTVQSVVNMLKKMGIEVDPKMLRVKNVAAVMVTANLKPFLKPGTRMDVSVSSIGDARSLEGGTLLMTPLQSPFDETYVVAQGALSVGGMQAQGRSGSRISRNHVMVGNIPNGGIVKKAVNTKELLQDGQLTWILESPDFTSAVAMAQAVNAQFPGVAKAQDAGTVAVTVPEEFNEDLMAFISRTETTNFVVNTAARIVLNEKTGTLVAGNDVQIAQVAVSHGSITIQIESETTTTQPNPFSMGTTGSTIQDQIRMQEPEQTSEVRVIPAVSNAGELAQALNALGVSPQDIIAIFQAIKQAGALHAELIIM